MIKLLCSKYIFEEAGKSFGEMTMTGWDGKTLQHGTSSGWAFGPILGKSAQIGRSKMALPVE